MAFAAVTTLMDMLEQNFLLPKPRFALRNKRKVRLLYRNLRLLQATLEEEDSMLGKRKYSEAMKEVHALLRDGSTELRFQVEHHLRLFYLGAAMKVRLESARKLLHQLLNNEQTQDQRSMLGMLLRHLLLPVSSPMPARIKRRVESLCTELETHYEKLHYEGNYEMEEQQFNYMLHKARSLLMLEMRASYLKKYKKQQTNARRLIRQIFTLGIKFTGFIKTELSKAKNAYQEHSQKSYADSLRGSDCENITTVDEDELQSTLKSSATIKMVGCDDEFNTIMEKISQRSSKQEIVSIVGMGGIGKTTIAKRIFEDESMVYHFDCRAWVTVSQEYNMRQVYLDISQSLGLAVSENDELALKVYQCLKGRRYLIVVDDIWSMDVWDNLRRCFPDDDNGSRVLFTTRLKNVAEFAISSSVFYHRMRFLDSEESWNLFQDKVSERVTLLPEFERIAREIVGKCEGLPLAISVAAGLLANSKQNIDEWKHIAKDVSALSLDHSDHYRANILNLSYTFLPHNLKICFLLFGIFPEDYRFYLEQIVELFVSEGSLKAGRYKSLEEVAMESIQNLVDRNLVQIWDYKNNGEIRSLRIHDVLRELALREARKEKLLPAGKKLDGLICVRHIQSRSVNFYLKFQQWMFQSRIGYDCSFYSAVLRAITPAVVGCSNFNLLRVLDLFRNGSISDPRIMNAIMGLVHLRSLRIVTSFAAEFIPWSMLWNLQFLFVYSSTNSVQGIHVFPQLRRLTIRCNPDKFSLVPPRSVQHNLECVRWLDYKSCTKELFIKIPNIRQLEISIQNEDSEYVDEEYNWVESFAYLPKLSKLCVIGKILCSNIKNMLGIDNIQQNLKSLVFTGTRLEWNDFDMVGMSPKLETLQLRWDAVVGPKWEPKDGGFRRLRYLCILDLTLQYWEATADHFPRMVRSIRRDPKWFC